MARKGKMKTSYLDLVNRTDLGRMRKMIPLFNNVGTKMGTFSTCVGWASVGYDALDAALQQEFEKSLLIATSGSAGLWVGATVTAYAIGAAGTTLLVATPFGWAIVVVVGIAAGHYIGAKTTEAVEYMFNGAKNYANQHSFVGKTGDFFYSVFQLIGQELIKD